MVQIQLSDKRVTAKIVFYGPGMSGKTTNLEVIHQRAPESSKGELTSISTDGDRTLFFDFMPLDLGTVAGLHTRFQLYTVPGQVYYNSTRKLVLRGTDGVIFVADSAPDMLEANLESLANLRENLAEYDKNLDDLPLIIQFNKRDLANAMPVEEMRAALRDALGGREVPDLEAVANSGQGVFPTLKALAALVLDRVHQQTGMAPAPVTPRPVAPGAPAPRAAAGIETPTVSHAAPAGNESHSPTQELPAPFTAPASQVAPAQTHATPAAYEAPAPTRELPTAHEAPAQNHEMSVPYEATTPCYEASTEQAAPAAQEMTELRSEPAAPLGSQHAASAPMEHLGLPSLSHSELGQAQTPSLAEPTPQLATAQSSVASAPESQARSAYNPASPVQPVTEAVRPDLEMPAIPAPQEQGSGLRLGGSMPAPVDAPPAPQAMAANPTPALPASPPKATSAAPVGHAAPHSFKTPSTSAKKSHVSLPPVASSVRPRSMALATTALVVTAFLSGIALGVFLAQPF